MTQGRGSRFRRFYLGARRRLGGVGRVATTSLLTGLGTYAAIKTGGRILRPLTRWQRLRTLSPRLVQDMERLPASARSWGLASGVIAGAGKTHGEVKGWWKRRYRRWLKGG